MCVKLNTLSEKILSRLFSRTSLGASVVCNRPASDVA